MVCTTSRDLIRGRGQVDAIAVPVKSVKFWRTGILLAQPLLQHEHSVSRSRKLKLLRPIKSSKGGRVFEGSRSWPFLLVHRWNAFPCREDLEAAVDVLGALIKDATAISGEGTRLLAGLVSELGLLTSASSNGIYF